MSLLASPLESVESAVIWLLVGFSVVTWGLALVKVAQFVRLKNQDKRFHQQFWAASSLDSAAELSHELPGPAARVAQSGYAAIAVGDTVRVHVRVQEEGDKFRIQATAREAGGLLRKSGVVCGMVGFDRDYTYWLIRRSQLSWAMHLMGGEPGAGLNRPKRFWGRMRRRR